MFIQAFRAYPKSLCLNGRCRSLKYRLIISSLNTWNSFIWKHVCSNKHQSCNKINKLLPPPPPFPLTASMLICMYTQ